MANKIGSAVRCHQWHTFPEKEYKQLEMEAVGGLHGQSAMSLPSLSASSAHNGGGVNLRYLGPQMQTLIYQSIAAWSLQDGPRLSREPWLNSSSLMNAHYMCAWGTSAICSPVFKTKVEVVYQLVLQIQIDQTEAYCFPREVCGNRGKTKFQQRNLPHTEAKSRLLPTAGRGD